mmetsp:Transcript_16890/g.51213  ORF Transcript_16890/g.51213 Transcript_16890/m.51213 type:complete len:268 (+) Transcript_16890:1195-1998(+)
MRAGDAGLGDDGRLAVVAAVGRPYQVRVAADDRVDGPAAPGALGGGPPEQIRVEPVAAVADRDDDVRAASKGGGLREDRVAERAGGVARVHILRPRREGPHGGRVGVSDEADGDAVRARDPRAADGLELPAEIRGHERRARFLGKVRELVGALEVVVPDRERAVAHRACGRRRETSVASADFCGRRTAGATLSARVATAGPAGGRRPRSARRASFRLIFAASDCWRHPLRARGNGTGGHREDNVRSAARASRGPSRRAPLFGSTPCR